MTDYRNAPIRAIRYLPPRNCARVAEFCGWTEMEPCGDCESGAFQVDPDVAVQPGEWLLTRDGSTFWTSDELIPAVLATAPGSWVEI